MLYAKVVVGLPIDGPFDYSVPANLCSKIKEGMRVWIQFGSRRMLGYVVRLTNETNIENVKPILDVIDVFPVLDKNMLLLTKELSDYYGCSWGEAIETAIPEGVRRGKLLPKADGLPNACIAGRGKNALDLSNPEALLVQSFDRISLWELYLKEIKTALTNHKSVIILFPDKDLVIKTKKLIESGCGRLPAVLYRQQSQELMEWINVKWKKYGVIIGTRSSVFAPVNNLGLIIIDEEHDNLYKQDQVPHYHPRDVAFMRMNIEKAKLILGSRFPSLESFYLAKRGKIKYASIPRRINFPEIKIIDRQREPYHLKQKNAILSKYLEDCIFEALNKKGKILLFFNRKGFATFASCRNCGLVLRCPRCNVNLAYHFKDNILKCHYCNFKAEAPKICPNCNSGYIRYLGMGIEKIESELARIFPQAKIKKLGNLKDKDSDGAGTDIFISTNSIIRGIGYPDYRNNFDLIGILSIDSSLNRIDFRSTEKTFALLTAFLGLTDKKIIIQTSLPKHYCLGAIANKDINLFYKEELKERRQLGLPPFKHLAIVKLRGKNEDRVKKISADLFSKLQRINKDKNINVVSVNPGEPAKLRGNFYWQVLIKGNSPFRMSRFVKSHLKNFPHSGIIITIDMDPL